MLSRKKCEFDGCNLPIRSRGLCNNHYRKLLRSEQTKCSVELCDKPIRNITYKLCYNHYENFLKKNNLQKKKRRPSSLNEEDAWEWCIKNYIKYPKNGCFEWTGPQRDSYGIFTWNNRKVHRYTHVYAYEKKYGPTGIFVVDHICRNHLCMNVDHLKLVTNEENSKSANFLGGERHGSGFKIPSTQDIINFWKIVDKSENGCWLWFGTSDGKGFTSYGRFWYQKKYRARPNRFSYWLKNKSFQEGYVVHHKCDVRACVRPDHLIEISTHKNAGISQSKYINYSSDLLFPEKERERLQADAISRLEKLEKQKKFNDKRKKNLWKDPDQKDVKRFFEKVDKETSGTGCWLWTGTIEKSGHGRFWLKGASQSAHYVSWFIANGIKNDRDKIHPTCDNLNCINPDHLEIVSKNESSRRARAKSLKKQKLKAIKK